MSKQYKEYSEGDLVVIDEVIKNKIGDNLKPTGTIVGVHGSDVSVLLENGDIWTGSTGKIQKQKRETSHGKKEN